jgi:hypothetical protein
MAWQAIVAGAAIQAIQAQRAAKAGQAGAQAGVEAQERMYNQTRSDLTPWRQSGQVALSELMERLGLASPSTRLAATGMSRPTREQYTENLPARGGQPASWFNPSGTRGTPGGSRFDQSGFDAAMADYEAALQDAGVERENYGSLMQPFTQEQFQESPGYQFNLEQGMEAIRKGAAANSGTTYAPQTLRDMGRFAQGTASNEWGRERDAYNQERGRQFGMLSGVSGAGQSAANQTGLAGVATGQGVAESLAGGANARAAGYVGVGNAINQGIGSAYNNYLQQQIINNQAPTYQPNKDIYNKGHSGTGWY